MAQAFLLDEHFRGPLWQAILRHNLHGEHAFDVVRVGDLSAPPFGSDDAQLLQWAEREARILVTRDRRTMPGHLRSHLSQGRHSPGILMARRRTRIRELMESLTLIAHAGEPEDFADAITYIP